MKLKNTILYLAALSLFSCEMKDEIFNKNEISGDVGYLNLAVSVQNKATKSAEDEGINNNSPVSADDFNVEISNSEGIVKKFESYSELPETIELPEGSYTVKAHTPGEILPQMPEPYYNGETLLNITKDKETTADVTCTMQNTRIQLVYGETFATVFKTWNITVSDGTGNILSFDETNTTPAAVYWLIADEVSEIKVHIEAKLPDGGVISEDRVITKPEDAESDFWAGSDALTITMEPGKPTNPDNPSGVTIDVEVNITFTDSEVTENIPVEGGNDGGEGEGDNSAAGPTLSGEYLNKTVTYDKGSDKPFPDVSVEMNVPGIIKNVMIKATTSDEELGEILAGMRFMDKPDGVDLVGNSDLGSLFDLPTNSDYYKFTLGELGGMLTVGQHTFTVKIIDQNNKEAIGSLSFDITDSTAN